MSSLTPEKIIELEEIARYLRVESLRLIHRRGAGHPGGALSAAEIMAVLYFHILRVDPADPNWEERDRFIRKVLDEGFVENYELKLKKKNQATFSKKL